MDEKDLRVQALVFIWGWASYLHEGIESGKLSEHFETEVDDGRMSEEDAVKCQAWVKYEAEIIWKKSVRLAPPGE
ncbi:hypothetical protein LCGC14_2406120 [marine sediment metagenome]|uniref:Uncharacterized protein n=1 Tax=marine sediment metagenome TaxID=412755 RepID=A0A0F9BTW0_9ZZZZ